MNNMNYKAILLAVFVVFIWGLNPAVAKLGMQEIPVFSFLAFRYLLTFLIFVPFAKVKKQDWLVIISNALLANVFSNGLQFFAFQYLSPTASTLLLQTETPVTIVMAWLFCHERINLRMAGGIILSILGVVTILGIPEMNLWAAFLILLTRIGWGICQLMFKKTSQMQAAAFISYSALLAFPFLAILAFFIENPKIEVLEPLFNPIDFSIMFFQVVCLSMALIIWQKLIAHYGVNSVSPYAILQIIFGILGGVIIFNDKIDIYSVLGIVMIMSGVILTTYKYQPKAD